MLTINDNPPKNPNDPVLYLSEEAASELNIHEEGTFPCEILVPKLEDIKIFVNNYSHLLPIFGLLFIAWKFFGQLFQ